MCRLAVAPAQTQLELAKAISYDKTRLIGLLDKLERDGLITRTPDPADRRARILRLTPAGRALHAAAQRDIRAMEKRLLAGVTAAERQRLWRLLAELSSDAK